MSIVKMDRLTVVGLKQDKDAVIESLMRLGAIEIDCSNEPDFDNDEAKSAGEKPLKEALDILSRLEKAVQEANRLSHEKKPMFSGRRQITSENFIGVSKREKDILSRVGQMEYIKTRKSELHTQISRFTGRIELLDPWKELELDLSEQETKEVCLFLGSFDSSEQIDKLQTILSQEAPESAVQTLAVDEAGIRCIVYSWKPHEQTVQAELRRCGFDPLPLQGEKGTPAVLLAAAEAGLRDMNDELEQLDRELEACVTHLADFELLHDYYLVQTEKLQAVSNLEETGSTFWLHGWVPAHLSESVKKGLNSRYTIALETRPAQSGEEYPIMFHNNPLVKPYEVIVEMFSPPSTREIDPSPLLAPFFFLIFGMMLSDVGYGLMLSGLCGLLIYKFKVGGEMGRMARMLFLSGIASILWGFVFGGYFGDMVSVLSGQRLILPAIWFNPMDDPTLLLVWSMIFGLIHIFIGMAAKAYLLFLTGQWQDAVLDIFPWYLILTGLGLTAGSIGGSAGLYMAAAGGAVLVFFGGRQEKNPLKRLLKGVMSLYDITGYFSDILSYTRILALVLATSVIAMVVNLLGFLLGPTIPGIIVFVLVAVFGHCLNLALSALSAYVHTCRLHYVEFFSKFYEGGGRIWQPLKLKTRYIDIVRNK